MSPRSNELIVRRFEVRILRQDKPHTASYWERFRLDYEPGLNVTSVLQRIAAHPITTAGQAVAPVAYEANCLEEVCGSCSMLINGRVRQACSALIDHLLAESSEPIDLRPLSKFPVIRDLIVARERLFRPWRNYAAGSKSMVTLIAGQDLDNRRMNSRWPTR